MKNLKAIIIFLLFWSIVIWCAKLMKRKDKQQYIDFYYLLKSFGESVIESANQIDICVKATVEGKINNVKN